jgi:lipopolysaccharide/colanic/teichoic acid biosynthesis glycosyltransferase
MIPRTSGAGPRSPAPPREQSGLIAGIALLLDLAALALLLPQDAVLRGILTAIPVLAAFRHFQPRRGRAFGTLAAGTLLASGVLLLLLAAWNRWATPVPVWHLIAGALVAPWPGHALALLPRILPRLPRGQALLHDGMARAVKRALDLLACAVFVIPAIPVVLVAAALVRLTTPGPAFYSQTRVTKGGRVFRIWKLRSMIRDAEVGKPVWPEENDPRITPVGRFLRQVWVDELPQMWNVLAGDMSVLGPRPERPEFVEAFAAELPKYKERHAVAAGITGLAQVSGLIGNTSIRRRLALDRHYIRIWTPCLDLWILARTVTQALRRAFGKRGQVVQPASRSSDVGGSSRELGSIARHLPERDQ